MSLLKAHRLLIGSGIAMCVVYIVTHVIRYSGTHASADLLRALMALAAAIGLGLYFRSIRTS